MFSKIGEGVLDAVFCFGLEEVLLVDGVGLFVDEGS